MIRYLGLLGATLLVFLLSYCAVVRPSFNNPTLQIPPDIAPPRISALLEAHCARCHSGTSPGGGLDLTNPKQVDSYATYAALYDRLTATDPARRMPPGGGISEDDRELLYLWVEGALRLTKP